MEYIFSFLFSVLATTIGVILAFLVQRLYDDFKEKKEAKELKLKIKNELTGIKDYIKAIHTRGEDMLLLDPIKMPVFQGAIYSSKIVLLDRYEWYDDLLNLYKTLDIYNAWHDLKTNKAFDGVSIASIKKNLQMIEKTLLGTEEAETEGEIFRLISKLSIEDNSDLIKKRKRR